MATPTFQAAGVAVTSTGAALSIAWPTHTTNDIGILVIESSGNSAAQGAIAGWTEIYPSPLTDVASIAGSIFQVFWKRAASAAEANVATSARTDHQLGRIYTFRGCVTTGSPINASAGSWQVGSVSTVVAAGLVTINDNCRVVVIASRPNDSAATNHFSSPVNASLASITAHGEAGTADGNGGGFTCYSGTKATAGTVNTTSISKGSATSYLAFTIALCDTATVAALANEYFGAKV